MVLLHRFVIVFSAIFILIVLAGSVIAVNDLTMFTTRLNWFDGNDTDSTRAFNRTLLVKWTGGVQSASAVFVDVYLNRSEVNNFNFTVANGCGFGPSIANCTCDSSRQKMNCTIWDNASMPVGVTWNGTSGPLFSAELTLFTTAANATNGSSTLAFNAANLSWLRIPESKVFHTLVEFGRGRGNYFFDSAGRETSAGVGIGQPYLPNGSRIELNYLHKVFNLRQYFGLPVEKAENATWRCLYPNSSVVRNHLMTSIGRSAGIFNATFRIPEIEGSFERQGYLGQQFEPIEAIFGETKIINCTSFSYTLGNASGNISVEVDDFNLSVRDRESVNFTASTGTTAVGSGTQEVIINYTIHNKEVFPVTDVIVAIGAPVHSKFIGTRLELWGAGLDKYIVERPLIPAQSSETIELVARFNTSNADAGLTLLNLSGPSRISVVNPWDKNAYNPAETIYNYQDRHTVTVDLSVVSRIDPLSDLNQLTRNLTNITLRLNESLFVINQTLVDRIAAMNVSLYELILNSTNRSQELLLNLTNITVNINSTLVDRLGGINNSLTLLILNLTNITLEMNRSLFAINQTLVDRLVGINVSLQTINQTLVDRIAEINISLQRINESLFDFLVSFNRTIFSQLQNLTNITIDVNKSVQSIIGNISQIRVRVDRIEEFENEVIFLVTDSFGMEQAAVQQLNEGKIGDAVDSLRTVNADLNQLASRIAQERALALAQPSSIPQTQLSSPAGRAVAVESDRVRYSGSGLPWASILAFLAVLLILILVVHHMRAVRNDEF